jgi:hypothetical protein
MITDRELAELIAATPDGEPLFASLDEMCGRVGFDDATKGKIRRDMEWTAPRDSGDTLQ